MKERLGPVVGALLAVGLGVTPLPVRGAADAPAKPSFSGRWDLDPEGSDDGHQKMKESQGERRRGGRGMGGGPMGGAPMGGGPMGSGPAGGPMGGPGMGGMMGAPPDPQEAERMRAAMDDVLRPTTSLLVSQDGVSFEIVKEGEHIDRLYADGRKNKGASGVERRTRWSGATLVTESKVGGGFGAQVRITETWALVAAVALTGGSASPGGSGAEAERAAPEAGPRLSITTRLEGGPFEKPLVLKRLYDRAPAP